MSAANGARNPVGAAAVVAARISLSFHPHKMRRILLLGFGCGALAAASVGCQQPPRAAPPEVSPARRLADIVLAADSRLDRRHRSLGPHARRHAGRLRAARARPSGAGLGHPACIRRPAPARGPALQAGSPVGRPCPQLRLRDRRRSTRARRVRSRRRIRSDGRADRQGHHDRCGRRADLQGHALAHAGAGRGGRADRPGAADGGHLLRRARLLVGAAAGRQLPAGRRTPDPRRRVRGLRGHPGRGVRGERQAAASFPLCNGWRQGRPTTTKRAAR